MQTSILNSSLLTLNFEQRETMSKDKRYNKEITSVEWTRLAKRLKAEANMQCSMCHCVTNRLAVHHIQPVENIKDDDEFKRKFYDRGNLRVLCYQCHKEVHEEMGSRGRAGHQEAEQRRTERAKEHIEGITMPVGF